MFFKISDSEYIYGIGIGRIGIEISESEFNEISNALNMKPTPSGGKDYRLKIDHTWEEYEIIPPVEPIDELTDTDKAEAYDILMGVIE